MCNADGSTKKAAVMFATISARYIWYIAGCFILFEKAVLASIPDMYVVQ